MIPKDEMNTEPPRGAPPATPGWVIAFGVIAAVLVVAFIVLHLMGGGFRGH